MRFAAQNTPYLVNIARAVSCSAFTLQIWELFHSLPDEVELIWRYLLQSTTGFNLAMNEQMYLNKTRPGLCTAVIAGRALCAQLTLGCVETIMLMRVLLLYNRSRRAQYFLKTVYALGFLLETVGQAAIIAYLQVEISHRNDDNACIIRSYGTKWLIIFAVGAGLVEGTLLIMTGIHILKVRQWQWLRTPLASRMLRDGFMVFLFFIILACTIISIEMIDQIPRPLWSAAYAWYIAFLSIVGCRLILGMRRLVPTANPDEFSELQLTSIVLTDLF